MDGPKCMNTQSNAKKKRKEQFTPKYTFLTSSMSKSGSKLLQKTKMIPIHKVADMKTHEQFAGNIFDDTQKKAGLTIRRR